MDEPELFNLGKRITEYRRKKGLSVEELAAQIGKDRSTVYRYENGEIRDITLAVVHDMAIALDVSPIVLAGFKEDEQDDRQAARAEIQRALREQLALLRRASEQVAAQDNFYDEQCRALCNLSDALVKVSACLRGTVK